jgi:hypothetical protein
MFYGFAIKSQFLLQFAVPLGVSSCIEYDLQIYKKYVYNELLMIISDVDLTTTMRESKRKSLGIPCTNPTCVGDFCSAPYT